MVLTRVRKNYRPCACGQLLFVSGFVPMVGFVIFTACRCHSVVQGFRFSASSHGSCAMVHPRYHLGSTAFAFPWHFNSSVTEVPTLDARESRDWKMQSQSGVRLNLVCCLRFSVNRGNPLLPLPPPEEGIRGGEGGCDLQKHNLAIRIARLANKSLCDWQRSSKRLTIN